MLFLLSSSYPPYSFKAHICLKPGANVDLWPLYKASCFVLHHQSLLSFPLILAVTAYYTISSLQFTLHPILPLNLFSAHYIYLSPPPLSSLLFEVLLSIIFFPWCKQSPINLYIHADLILVSLLWGGHVCCWLCRMMEHISPVRLPLESCSSWIHLNSAE